MPETPETTTYPPTVWSDSVAPGGMVCAVPNPRSLDGICGMPVESEPCPEHRFEVPAELVALVTPIMRRPCPRCRRPEPRTTGDDVDCVTCLDSGSIGPVFMPAEAAEYATRILAAVLPAHRRMVLQSFACQPPGVAVLTEEDLAARDAEIEQRVRAKVAEEIEERFAPVDPETGQVYDRTALEVVQWLRGERP